MREVSVYIHIPFCERKCNYCSFCSQVASRDKQAEYVSALEQEIAMRSDKTADVATVYFGGGTPSLIDAELILRIVDAVKAGFNLSDNAEITLEANPNSVTNEKLDIYKKCGVNRISLGLQSHKGKLLSMLGRPHDYAQFERAVEFVKASGFNNFNVDVMLGLPGQKVGHVRRTLKKVIKSGATHISAYGLILEFGTRLENAVSEGELLECPEDLAVEMYNVACKLLARRGFERYEISNFARSGFESKHNLNYWARGEYLGFGLSAYTFNKGERKENTHNLEDYIEQIAKGKLPVISVEKESKETAEKEYIMLSLRTSRGIDLLDYATKFKKDFVKTYRSSVEQMIGSGFMHLNDGRLFVDEEHFNVSNLIIEKFF